MLLKIDGCSLKFCVKYVFSRRLCVALCFLQTIVFIRKPCIKEPVGEVRLEVLYEYSSFLVDFVLHSVILINDGIYLENTVQKRRWVENETAPFSLPKI